MASAIATSLCRVILIFEESVSTIDTLWPRASTSWESSVRLCSPQAVRLCSPQAVRLCSPQAVRPCSPQALILLRSKFFRFSYADQLLQINPRIVFCSIAGYGQDSPWASRPGHDINYQGVAGVLSLSGAPDGPPDYTIGVAAADLTASLFALSSIIAALFHREKTGKGNCIEVAIADVAVSLMSNRIGEFFARGRPSKSQQMGRAAAGVFETKDGKYITLAAAEEHFWKRLCQVLDLKELSQDQRFSSTLNRSKYRKEINERLAEVFRTREQKEWSNILEKADLPWGPVNTIEDLPNDPYISSRQLVLPQEHPSLGNIWQVAFPVKSLSEQPEIKHPAPSLGQHNREILNSLGYRDEDMAIFKEEKII